MSDYEVKVQELEDKKENLIKQRDKINAALKRVELKIDDYRNLIKIRDFMLL